MSDIDTLIAKMRAGLEGVTPGPWHYFPHEHSNYAGPGTDAFMSNEEDVQVIDCNWASATEEGDRTYKHIARCSPDNIAALLDEIEKLRAQMERLEASHAVARGEWARSLAEMTVNLDEARVENARLQQAFNLVEKYHQDEMARLDEQIKANNEYSARTGRKVDDANENCRTGQYYSRQALKQIAEARAAVGGEPSKPDVIAEIAAERRRQIEVEGWTPEHDDEHEEGSLASAAGCYAHYASLPNEVRAANTWWPRNWPWQSSFWNPKGRRRDLIRAAALIVAEIERLDRRARG